MNPRDLLQALFLSAIGRAHPREVMATYLPAPPKGRTVVVGAGKAAAAMAYAVEEHWPSGHAISGAVATRYGHVPPHPPGLAHRIDILEAAHPVPDQASVDAAERMLSEVAGLTEDDLVLCLLSGGASSLLVLPVEGLSLEQKQDINRQLLASGANIKDMNVIRRHLSRIKGGQLAKACAPAKVVTLAISDVPRDDPSVIGSGPTIPCSSSPGEALELLKRHGIRVPGSVLEHLEREARAHAADASPSTWNQNVSLIATPWKSLQAAAEAARLAGFNVHVLSDSIEGESREVAKVHAEIARAVAHGKSSLQRPCVILSGGETTVTVNPLVPNRGRGGRAGEFCLGLALALGGEPNIWALAADTDGIDGVELNAGAFVAPDTIARGELAGLSLQRHLDRHDSYGFFKTLNDLVITGPTHTNVNDFRAILVL
ncbi:glycerate kinase type-2 family protein [Hydrogenophaga sp. SL48]|uniref:glycerate kinase type-2 family protein n=1 Tax=Hydrogenophaga sp. SL48 TaxID=2806347 RepID=UPI001F3CE895|nr:glycerate kinase [Hydrogenophaga sp. SL48]UJW81150.1 glycerate kinase [Hydrogenophaga sp. SL48]